MDNPGTWTGELDALFGKMCSGRRYCGCAGLARTYIDNPGTWTEELDALFGNR